MILRSRGGKNTRTTAGSYYVWRQWLRIFLRETPVFCVAIVESLRLGFVGPAASLYRLGIQAGCPTFPGTK